jgi:Rieske Fe-S protein
MDPASGVVRDGSLLNMLILIRLDPGELKKKTLDNSAEGVVAYSAVCTHQACPVSMWREEKKVLFCSCHGSQFDPKDGAKVAFGPAKNRLAALPVKMQDGVLTVAGDFTRRVGADKR